MNGRMYITADILYRVCAVGSIRYFNFLKLKRSVIFLKNVFLKYFVPVDIYFNTILQ